MKYRSTCYSDDGTIKYVFDTPIKGFNKTIGGSRDVGIESALIHIPRRDDDKPEYILCLSSQIGCVYRCHMCANMFSSFYGCLTPAEIEKQIKLTLSYDNNLEKIKSSGCVEYAFMAMGEPLYGHNVIMTIQEHKEHVPNTTFSLATAGALGTIDKLTDSYLPYPTRLELSLHFTDDTIRREWLEPDMWWFRKRPSLSISRMIEEAEKYVQKYPGKVTLNYTLIDGVNNMEHNIEELSKIIKGQTDVFYVKVMKPNMTSSFLFSHKDECEWGRKSKRYNPNEFKDKLLEAGIPATLFESKGQDVSAGCGMMTTRVDGAKGILFARDIIIPQADYSKSGF
ncbi:MAG: radical SAM protein [Candidatus Aenigmatarchaeota archaeon]